MGELNELLALAEDMEPLEKKIRAAEKTGKVTTAPGIERVGAAQKAAILGSEQALQLRDYYKRVMAIINVEEFDNGEISHQGRSAHPVP